MTRLATILVVLTFALIFYGGQVTTTDSGDSVPSWPASFLVPKDSAQFWELGHRWIAVPVATVAAALAIWVLARDRRPLPRRLAVAVAAFVILQAIVGGVRVHLGKGVVSVIHATAAQAILACAVALRCSFTLATSEGIRYVRRRAFALAAVVWCQALFGAILRHITRDKNTWGLSLHLAGAMLVIIFAVRLVVPIQEHLRKNRRFLIPARLIAAAIFGQLILGLAAWTTTHTASGYVNPTDASSLIPTLHVVLGAGILSLSVMIGMRATPVATGSAGLRPAS